MTNTQKAQRIFDTVEELLRSAEYGLDDMLRSSSPRALHGLKTLIVFGRAVTNVLDNLKSIWPGYHRWSQKFKGEMEADPLMKYFYKLRSVILKKASHQIGVIFEVKEVDLPGDLLGIGSPPSNALGAFIGGSGLGWVLKNPDGSLERHYVDLPPERVSMSLVLPDPPSCHLGENISDTSAANLARKYLDYLKSMVESAKNQFNRESQMVQ